MTTAQATEAAAFITHRGLRLQAIHRLTTGALFICPNCTQFASSDTGCTCMADSFDAQCAEHDAVMENAETATGCDAYARY